MPAGFPLALEDRVIAEMRIAVDDAEAAERQPPGGEHRVGEPIARRRARRPCVSSILRPSSQSIVSRRPVDSSGQTFGTRIDVFVLRASRDRARRASLRGDSRAPRAAARRSHRDLGWCRSPDRSACGSRTAMQLIEVGFDRRLHVGILQLAGQRVAIERARAMHLAERGGGRRMMFEFGEFLLPVGAQLGAHAPLDEGPAHGRRLALQLHQFVGVFRRQRVRNGGEQLRHLHDRAFQPAERGGQFQRIAGAIELARRTARAGNARGDAADAACRPGIAAWRGRRSGSFRGRT